MFLSYYFSVTIKSLSVSPLPRLWFPQFFWNNLKFLIIQAKLYRHYDLNMPLSYRRIELFIEFLWFPRDYLKITWVVCVVCVYTYINISIVLSGSKRYNRGKINRMAVPWSKHSCHIRTAISTYLLLKNFDRHRHRVTASDFISKTARPLNGLFKYTYTACRITRTRTRQERVFTELVLVKSRLENKPHRVKCV